MRHLNKFNEELKSQTYKTTAWKLKKLGHSGKRIDDLIDWSSKVEDRENIEKWENNKREFSKFGKFKLSITQKNGDEMIGDFYLDLVFDRATFGDSFEDTKLDNNGFFWIAVGIIPVDQETLDKCIKSFPDNDFGNGFFWGLSITLNFKLEANSMKFKSIGMYNYDTEITGAIQFANRGTTGRFRNLLKKIFGDPNFGYPSGYTDFGNIYDMSNTYFGSTMGLSNDYGFSPEMISDFINTISPNTMIVKKWGM